MLETLFIFALMGAMLLIGGAIHGIWTWLGNRQRYSALRRNNQAITRALTHATKHAYSRRYR